MNRVITGLNDLVEVYATSGTIKGITGLFHRVRFRRTKRRTYHLAVKRKSMQIFSAKYQIFITLSTESSSVNKNRVCGLLHAARQPRFVTCLPIIAGRSSKLEPITGLSATKDLDLHSILNHDAYSRQKFRFHRENAIR